MASDCSFYQLYASSDYYRCSVFFSMTVVPWNRLPAEKVYLSDLNCFKREISTLCLRKLLLLYEVVTVKILKFGTPQTIAITVLKIEKFDVTLH